MSVRIVPASIVLIALLLSAVYAQQDQVITGNDFRQWSRTSQLSYVIGFVDGLYGARFPQSTNRILNCIEGRMLYAQLYAIVQKYLADHPEEWHEHIAQLTVDALYAGACP